MTIAALPHFQIAALKKGPSVETERPQRLLAI
jgi:hypothetical protein